MANNPERFSVHTLFQKLRAGNQLLDLVDAAFVVKETAARLNKAAAGVHGDLIPDNIQIDTVTGEVRLVGFGNNKVNTSISAPADRLRYLSPERISGEAPTTASDIFALGLIFWRLIYGRDLISSGSQKEIIEKFRTFSAPPFPSKPQVPSEVLSLLGQMLAPHPAGRLPANVVQEELSLMIARRDPSGTPTSCKQRLATLIRNLNTDPLSGILTGDKDIDLALPAFERPPLPWKRIALVSLIVVAAFAQRYYTTFKTKGAASVSTAVQTDLKLLFEKSKKAVNEIKQDAPSSPVAADAPPAANPNKKSDEPPPGPIPFRIDSTPRGAQVYIDQKPTTYYTPAVMEVDRESSLLITLKLRTYQDCSALISARVGIFKCTLEK